jgi:hypothetical protein
MRMRLSLALTIVRIQTPVVEELVIMRFGPHRDWQPAILRSGEKTPNNRSRGGAAWGEGVKALLPPKVNYPRWCANGLRSEPSSWFLQSPPPNGDWHTQTCHSIEHIASDLGFGALIEQTPSAKSSANDGLVAVDCCLNQAPCIVTRSTLPAYSTMLRNHRNMPVALSRRRPFATAVTRGGMITVAAGCRLATAS